MAESPNFWPPIDDRDITMGQFMDVWSALENKLFLFFWKLIGTNFYIARAIFSTGIQTTNLSELLISISPFRLTDSEQKTLKTLCKRYRSAAQKRNKIVHGVWYIETKADKSQWARIYSPINYQLRDEIHNPQNQKIHSAYRFTVRQLKEVVKQIKILHTDFNNLIFSFMDRLDIDRPDPEDQLHPQKSP
jgi:hypothetical protein